MAGPVPSHQLVHELFCPAAGVRTLVHVCWEVLEEQHQVAVLAGDAVGDDAPRRPRLAWLGEPAALRQPDEESRQPVGEARADEQQVGCCGSSWNS